MIDSDDNLVAGYIIDWDFGNGGLKRRVNGEWQTIPGDFHYFFPYSIDADDNGNLYVVNDYMLKRWDGGNWSDIPMGNYCPSAVALNSSNELYVYQTVIQGSCNAYIGLIKQSGEGWTELYELSTSRIDDWYNDIYIDRYDNIYAVNSTGHIYKILVTPPAVHGVTVSPATGSAAQGSSLQLTAQVDAVGFADDSVTWTCTDDKVTVDHTGKVTIAPDAALGDYTITAASVFDSSKQGTAVITVVEPPDTTAPTISSTSASDTAATGTTLHFTSDEAGTYYYLVYQASTPAPDKAAIEAQGTADAKGTAAAAAGANTVSVSGLTPSTAYKAYLIVKDTAGNVSDEAVISFATEAPPSSAISPTTASFDKYEASDGYKDLVIALTLNGNTLEGISNGDSLTSGTDYTADGSAVTIKKEYLAGLAAGTATLTFAFSAGQDQTLTVTITDSEPAPVGAPVLQSAAAGNAQVVLTWSPAADATAYKIYMSESSGTYGAATASVSGTVYSYTATGLTNGTTYYFVVTAVRSGIESDASNERSAVPYTVPAAPTNVTAAAGNGQATVTFTPPGDNGGSPITGYEVTISPGGHTVNASASPIVVTGLTNGTTYTFTVQAVNSAGSSDPSAASNAVTPSAPSSGGNDDIAPSQPAAPVNTEPNTGVKVLINGKEESAGTASTATRNGQTVTTVAIDPGILKEKLTAEGLNTVVTISVPAGSDVAVGELNGQMVRSMEDQRAILEIVTDRASYAIPATQLNIGAISAQLGASAALQDIKLYVEIGEPPADIVQWVDNGGAFEIVAAPIEFTVRASYEGTSLEISRFNAYVERSIAIPDGIDPGRITTGIVIDPDGTTRHVPTKVIAVDGRYYAVINSLTNSIYTVVWHPVEFADMSTHWAKDAVNNMASRMIAEGIGGGTFSPDRGITRAEFAAMLVRALGLAPEPGGAEVFSDVQASDWYSGVIHTAYAFDLLSGYADGSFRPNDLITREQAMVILSRTMDVTRVQDQLPGAINFSDEVLKGYADAGQISGWAIRGVASSVQAGIAAGRSGQKLAPQAEISRAEAAVMIERLLKKSDLIE